MRYEKIELDELRLLFNKVEFETWIETLEDVYKKDDEIHLVAVNEFHKILIKKKYLEKLVKFFDTAKVLINVGNHGSNIGIYGIYEGMRDMFEKYGVEDNDAMDNIIIDALVLALEKGKKEGIRLNQKYGKVKEEINA